MKRQTQWRFLLMLLIVGFTMLADKNAAAYSCEHICMPREEACLAGSTYPECGGDSSCCSKKLATCYANCTWY